MAELGKKRDPGIKGYDPKKVGKEFALKLLPCPYCWYETRSRSVLTRHINKDHWDLLKEAA